MTIRVVIADDHSVVRWGLRMFLELDPPVVHGLLLAHAIEERDSHPPAMDGPGEPIYSWHSHPPGINLKHIPRLP